MPNHCESDLRVNGPKTEVERFFETLRGDKGALDADKIIPYPEHFKELDAKAKAHTFRTGEHIADGYNSGGYEWCISNWGTKWGMYNFSELIFGKTFATVSFQSAWAPPLPLILKASEMFPKLVLTLKYYEMGAGFKGTYKVQGGRVLSESETKYSGTRGG